MIQLHIAQIVPRPRGLSLYLATSMTGSLILLICSVTILLTLYMMLK